MKADELKSLIEAQVTRLKGLTWSLHNEEEVKTMEQREGKYYSYYLRKDGRMQVLLGGTFLLDWQSDVFVPLAESLIPQAKENALDELAEVWRDAVPAVHDDIPF